MKTLAIIGISMMACVFATCTKNNAKEGWTCPGCECKAGAGCGCSPEAGCKCGPNGCDCK